MHPLTSLQAQSTLFQSSVILPDYPSGQCPSTMEDIRRWLETLSISVLSSRALFGYTAGTMDAATPEDYDRPRILFDDIGRFLGVALYMPELMGWSIGGQPGQLMTLARVKATVAEDIAARPLAGWRLADGSASGVPNLALDDDLVDPASAVADTVKSKSPWFRGTAPNWTIYTVAYVGA